MLRLVVVTAGPAGFALVGYSTARSRFAASNFGIAGMELMVAWVRMVVLHVVVAVATSAGIALVVPLLRGWSVA